MRSGTFRHKAHITAPTTARAADGSIENTYQDLGTFYASVRTQNAGETDEKGKLVTTVQHLIELRYNSTDMTSIPNNSRITIDGMSQVLHVTSSHVLNYRKRVIKITAEERL